jgi:hypothetical protein
MWGCESEKRDKRTRLAGVSPKATVAATGEETAMAIFAVSFRIAGRTTARGRYDERWETVDVAVKSSSTSRYWNETTAFYIIESDLSSQELVEVIQQTSKLDQSLDLLVCINLSQKGYQILGSNPDPDIDALMEAR